MNRRVLDLLSGGLLLTFALSQLAALALLGLAFVGFGGVFALVGISQKELEPLIAGGLFGGLGLVLVIFLLVQALPALVGGLALFTGKDWGRVLGAVAAALALPMVPVGTILGGAVLALMAYGASGKAPA